MNRRQSQMAHSFRAALVKLWKIRRVIVLAALYLVFFLWLFSGETMGNQRLPEHFELRGAPAWQAPGPGHPFGTAVNGADLYGLTRFALATGVSVAVLAVSLAIGAALLVTSLFVFEDRENRFERLERFCRACGMVPGLSLAAILLAGGGGGRLLEVLGLTAVLVIPLCPVLARWFRESEEDFDLVAARILGLSRRDVVLQRLMPGVLRRLPGVFAVWVPHALLAEMALSFLGLTGERPGVGAMIALGQDYLIEAPWMAIYPGFLAAVVVMILSFLGWRVSAALRTGPLPPVM
ncbi:MAG: hypothetical protein KDN18_06220 [Verrucomicrobiae bacterium]|nr:hypothetical protein [Verrucomicrobiae bacterium]